MLTMGGLNSHITSGPQHTENRDQDIPNDDQSRDEDTIGQSQQGAWDVLSWFGALNLLRRRRGADLYDEGKASTSVLDGADNPWGFTNINTRDTDGRTPLTSAIRSEDDRHRMANVKHILGHPDIDINYPELQQVGLYSHNEVPPIMVATKVKNKELVELLLEKGACVNALDSDHLSSLHYTAENGDLDILNLLLKYQPALTSKPDVEDPLHVACRLGYEEIIHQLVDAGADINPEKTNLTSPLMLAAENQHQKICVYLIKKLSSHKSYISVKDNLFIRACWFGCPLVVQYLIETGTNINVLSSHNSTGLVHALRSGDLARYGRELRGLSGQPRLQNHVIDTVRMVLYESVTIISMLCDNHADLELSSGMYRMSPLSLGLKASNIPAAIVLLKHGAVWDENCDYVFERNNLKRLHSVDPNTFSILLQFLGNKRRSIYKPRHYSNSIRTLKDCCRHVIRSRVRRQMSLSTSILPLLRSLPLPVLIKDFLCYSELDETQLVNCFQIMFVKS